MRRGDHRHVEPVSVVPPVIERGGSDHRGRSPRHHPGAERSPQRSDTDAGAARAVIPEGRLPDEGGGGEARQSAAEVNRQVRRRPECVASDRAVPGDVPQNPDHDAGGSERRGGKRAGQPVRFAANRAESSFDGGVRSSRGHLPGFPSGQCPKLWYNKTAAMTKPITMTAARALSWPILRANRAPA